MSEIQFFFDAASNFAPQIISGFFGLLTGGVTGGIFALKISKENNKNQKLIADINYLNQKSLADINQAQLLQANVLAQKLREQSQSIRLANRELQDASHVLLNLSYCHTFGADEHAELVKAFNAILANPYLSTGALPAPTPINCYLNEVYQRIGSNHLETFKKLRAQHYILTEEMFVELRKHHSDNTRVDFHSINAPLVNVFHGNGTFEKNTSIVIAYRESTLLLAVEFSRIETFYFSQLDEIASKICNSSDMTNSAEADFLRK